MEFGYTTIQTRTAAEFKYWEAVPCSMLRCFSPSALPLISLPGSPRDTLRWRKLHASLSISSALSLRESRGW
eukprot:Skav215844  [mRNA]  locus=scaffold1630:128346:128663:- [translate_table: standard]